MNVFKITSDGTIPKSISDLIQKYDGKEVTTGMVNQLESHISYIVIDLKEAHGNYNKYAKDAWLFNSHFNISIKW